MPDISKDSLIIDIIKKYPAAMEVLTANNMSCPSCLGIQGESLEKGCLMHGLEVEKVLEEIKHTLEKEESRDL